MPLPEPLLVAGSLAGIAGLTFASFTAVSYLEVKRKIDEQLAAGEEPYQLKVEQRVEQRQQPPRKAGGKKAGSVKRKK